MHFKIGPFMIVTSVGMIHLIEQYGRERGFLVNGDQIVPKYDGMMAVLELFRRFLFN